MISLDLIFNFCTAVALIGWLALAIAPVNRIYAIGFARGLALVLAVAYIAQLAFTTEPSGGDFNSLAGITALFSRPGNVMLGWTHFLAFDLFIGSWIVENSNVSRVAHWLILPCLFLTLMFGPIGLLAYFVVRTVSTRISR